MVDRLERGGEAMVSLDDNSLLVGAEDGKSLGSVLDDGDITLGVGDKEIFGDGTRNALENVEGLAGGAAILDDITNEVRRGETVAPLVDMSVGESDIETMLIDAVFGIKFAGVLAEVTAPDAFVGEKKVAISARKSELILLEKFPSGGLPVVVATDESLAFLMKSKNGAAVSVLMNTALLMIDERGEVFVEEKARVETDSASGGGDFCDEGGIMFLIDLKLVAEGGRVEVGIEIMVTVTEILTVEDTKILVRAAKLNHKNIIA